MRGRSGVFGMRNLYFSEESSWQNNRYCRNADTPHFRPLPPHSGDDVREIRQWRAEALTRTPRRRAGPPPAPPDPRLCGRMRPWANRRGHFLR